MELRHLRYFVAVAEEQNITRAAARLHVSQPPLSRQIRDLEHELGVTLFERQPKSVRLTDAGRVFLQEARAVLQRAQQAAQTVKAFADGKHGEIHVGYAPSLTVQLLPQALRLYQEKFPQIRVVLHDLSTEEMLEGLHQERLHLALMIKPSPKTLRDLVFQELRRYALCVAVNPTHAFARTRSVTLAQVAADRVLGYSRADYPEYHEWLEELFASVGLKPQLAEEHDGATSLVAAVEAGRGVALVPQSFACFVGARLKLRPLAPAVSPFVVVAAWRKRMTFPAARGFIELLKQSAVERDLV